MKEGEREIFKTKEILILNFFCFLIGDNWSPPMICLFLPNNGFYPKSILLFRFYKNGRGEKSRWLFRFENAKKPYLQHPTKPITNISMTTGDNSTAGHHLSHSDVKPTSDLHPRHYSCLLRFSPENGVFHPFPSPYLQDLQLLSHFFNLYLIYLRERERERNKKNIYFVRVEIEDYRYIYKTVPRTVWRPNRRQLLRRR